MSYGTPPPQQPGQHPQPGWGQQPQQQPGWGAGGPPQPRKNNAGKVIGFGCGGLVLLFVIIAVIGAVLTSGDSTDDDGSDPVLEVTASGTPSAPAKEKSAAPAPKGAEADVKITSCEVSGATTWPAAELEIVNHSSSKANYIVSIEFVDAAGTRLGEGMAATNNLAPDQKALEKAQGLSKTNGKITCKVSKVTRYPAG
jgi:hypothetical protein